MIGHEYDFLATTPPVPSCATAARPSPRPHTHVCQVAEPLEPAVLSGVLFPGQRYFVLGQSSQAQPDESSVTHGRIAAAELDARCHVRGDIPAGVGDSGGGVFSVDTGALIGIVVDTHHETHKAVLLPSSVIQSKLPILTPAP